MAYDAAETRTLEAPPATSGRTPDPVDVAVGRRMRNRRKALGISQEALGEALGITFQQIQKYESGANRISASKMFAAARALNTTPESFFHGLPSPVTDPDAALDITPRGQDLTDNPVGARLAQAALRLPPALLLQLAQLAEIMADAVADTGAREEAAA